MLDFSHWPPSNEDFVRLQGYDVRERLFNSDFKNAFNQSSAYIEPGLKSKVYLQADWPKKIVLDSADMLMGEFPIITQDDQAQLEKLMQDTKLPRTLYQCCVSTCYRGDGVMSLRTSLCPDGLAIVAETKSASCYFVEQDPDNANCILSEALAWIRTDATGREILRVDHHFPNGTIYREAWLLKSFAWATGPGRAVGDPFGPYSPGQFVQGALNTNIGGFLPFSPELIQRNIKISLGELYGKNAPPETEDNQLGRSLLFHVPNWLDDTKHFGFSDYSEALITLFDAYNERVTEIHRILSCHCDPKLVCPEGTLDENGQVKKQNIQLFEVPMGSDPMNPRYLTWDGQLLAAYTELKKLEDLIFKMSETYGLDFSQAPLSVDSTGAMRLLFMDPVKKATRKKLYWDPFLKDVIYWAQVLAAKAGVKGYKAPAERPKIVWQDGLPHNVHEQVQIEVLRVQNDLSSRESAIQRIDQCTPELAQAELKQMKVEEKADPPPVSPLPPFPETPIPSPKPKE